MALSCLSPFLLISLLVVPLRSVNVKDHVLTEEEERCAMFALHKMAAESDLVFKHKLATALKMVSGGEIEKTMAYIDRQPKDVKDKMMSEYLVDDCLPMRQYFISPGNEPAD